MGKKLTIAFSVLLILMTVSTAAAKSTLQQIGEFVVPEANQGVGVDDRYFYAIDNQTIAKYDKKTGKLVRKWQGEKNGPIIHLDSAVLLDGKIYCAHSNYSAWPMTSSLEIWDAGTMEHIGDPDEHQGPGNCLGPFCPGCHLWDYPRHGKGEGRGRRPQGDRVPAPRHAIAKGYREGAPPSCQKSSRSAIT
jgi:hypothetical protein